ncbi:MAG: hypothetical protein ACLQOO_08300 [Terriglobia bacterium]
MSNKPSRNRKTPVAAAPDYGAAVAAARPKVRELLAEYQADPTGDAGSIVEILVLNQLAGEPGREAEVLLHQERGRRGTLGSDTGQTSTQLARQNRRLKRDLAKSQAVEANVRQYLEKLAAAGPAGREPTQAEIIEKISAAIGLRGPLIERVETGPVPHA